MRKSGRAVQKYHKNQSIYLFAYRFAPSEASRCSTVTLAMALKMSPTTALVSDARSTEASFKALYSCRNAAGSAPAPIAVTASLEESNSTSAAAIAAEASALSRLAKRGSSLTLVRAFSASAASYTAAVLAAKAL